MKNPSTRINWPHKAELQEMLWALPIAQIAHQLGCSHGLVLGKAKLLKLPIPGPGYWQKKKGIIGSDAAGKTI